MHRAQSLVALSELVIALDIADILLGEDLVSVLHLIDSPCQRAGGLAGIGHNGNRQMSYAVIDGKLDLFGVDHQKLNFVGRRIVEYAYDHRVDTHRLT